MPRKKPRNPLKRKQAEFDTDPDVFINPKKNSKKAKSDTRRTNEQNEEELGGAMPKEFKRLMNWSQKLQGKQQDKPEGRDQGKEKGPRKGRETDSDRGRTKSRETVPTTELKILPGERMSDFSRRVNEALPLAKPRKGSPSRADKRKARKRAKAEEERKKSKGSDDEDEDEEEQMNKRGKREPSPDPWAHLESQKPKFGDIVDRPPELTLPTKLLRNVPKAAGSLARRAMLEDERTRVINSYRALMEEKRGQSNV